MESLASWIGINMKILFLALFAQILLSESSPLNNESREGSSVCSKGWIHYQRFCVTRAEGETEAAMALYCGGYGGIGIKGFCISKAHASDGEKDTGSRIRQELLRAAALKTGRDNAVADLMDSAASSELDSGASSDHYKAMEQIACPDGWSHYLSLCVYRPMSVATRCHHMGAVEFNGLCLRHADTEALAKRGLDYGSTGKEKRVCCCSHVVAKSNGYGCF